MPHAPSAGNRRSTSGRRLVAVATVTMLALHSPAGWAAKVYRCGNVFQDLPCPEPKAPDVRPNERPAAARDASPCGAATKDATGRNECIVRTATRDSQPLSVVEAKR